MKSFLTQAKIVLAFGLPLLFLFSCAGITKAPQHLSPALETAEITTLGILPVTYDRKYDEPLDVRLSPLILRHTEKLLQAKGYRTLLISAPLPAGWESLDSLALEPTEIIAGLPAGVDAAVVIRVRSHFGIEITERKPDTMGPAITINATSKLVSKQPPEELWRDKAMGRSYVEGRFFRRTQFLIRLDQAVRSLVDNLFLSLPAKHN